MKFLNDQSELSLILFQLDMQEICVIEAIWPAYFRLFSLNRLHPRYHWIITSRDDHHMTTETDLTGCFWTGLIERINSNQRNPGCPEVVKPARSRSSRSCAGSRCNWRRAKAWPKPVRRPASPSRTQ